MYEHILVPSDGSDGAAEALRHGLDLAEHYQATIHLVYVVDEEVYDHYGGIDAFEHAQQALENAGQRALRAARERVEDASIACETHLERASPHEGIVDAARRIGADLIVMGTERHSEEYRQLLGSVTERVLRTSAVPVQVVKAVPSDAEKLTIRTASQADAAAIAQLARRSMRRSYGDVLDEAAIEEAVDTWYGPETIADLLGDSNAVVLVAESPAADGIVGFSQSHLLGTPAGTIGEIHWLHVDPERRDRGVGRRLFETTRTTLETRGAEWIEGLVLAASAEGNAFYRDVGLEPVDSRPVEVAGRTLDERVYLSPGLTGGSRRPGIAPRTTGDGETLYVNYDERAIGSEGPFFAAYRTRELEGRYGWFCSNCESFDNAMDAMGRIVCNRCGNRHKATRWDDVATE